MYLSHSSLPVHTAVPLLCQVARYTSPARCIFHGGTLNSATVDISANALPLLSATHCRRDKSLRRDSLISRRDSRSVAVRLEKFHEEVARESLTNPLMTSRTKTKIDSGVFTWKRRISGIRLIEYLARPAPEMWQAEAEILDQGRLTLIVEGGGLPSGSECRPVIFTRDPDATISECCRGCN